MPVVPLLASIPHQVIEIQRDIKSVLGVGEPAIHSYFPEIWPPSDPKPLNIKEMVAVGLICPFFSHLYHNNSFNHLGFDPVLTHWPTTKRQNWTARRGPDTSHKADGPFQSPITRIPIRCHSLPGLGPKMANRSTKENGFEFGFVPRRSPLFSVSQWLRTGKVSLWRCLTSGREFPLSSVSLFRYTQQ